MSAFIVDRAHIDALVLGGVQWGLIPEPSPAVLAVTGQLLWAENYQSVVFRYPGDPSPPGPAGFTYEADVLGYTAPVVELVLAAAPMVCAVDGYIGQACQHPAWQITYNPMRGYVESLRQAIIDSAPPGDRYTASGRVVLRGYDAGPWSVHDLAQVSA